MQDFVKYLIGFLIAFAILGIMGYDNTKAIEKCMEVHSLEVCQHHVNR